MDEVIETWQAGQLPDAKLTISEWADEYRTLSAKAAAEAGRWRTARTPYLQAIMDALSSHSPIQRVVFMKGAQVGGTEAGNNWIGYVIHLSPAPMMAVSPTTELAKRNSKQRIDPLIEDCAALKARVKPARSRDSGNTVLSKEFPSGVLVMIMAVIVTIACSQFIDNDVKLTDESVLGCLRSPNSPKASGSLQEVGPMLDGPEYIPNSVW